ncbi:MAG: C69 family dipeptidase, partial [Candidatus Aminicenantes bacterium]|nr:C69 family dipeptidase [Candidatus Aminicenantes bacterium]
MGPLVLFLGFFLFLILPSDKAETPQVDFLGPLEGGCTSIMVGKNASADGSTMTTHSCDCAVCDFTWRHVPAQDHPRGATRKIRAISQYETWDPQQGLKWDLVNTEKLTRLEIPQVSHTYAYHHGMFGVMNEHQLAIGESSVGCRSEMRNPAGLMNL